MKPKALVVDDDVAVRYTLRSILEHAHLEVDEAADGVEALGRLSQGGYHLIITDLRMPHMDGLELLRKIQEQKDQPAPKVILITAHGSERHAVEAIKVGAYDYFRKPFNMDELMAAVQRAVESVRLHAEVERLAGELNLSRSLLFASPAMSQLALLVQRVGPRDVTVLLTGESGTGKERVAEALVRASARAERSYVRFNCAALAPELAEAELFGHSKGAFTGAHRARAGLFREADQGTLLLDEIGELAPATQAKLLRVLQEGEVRPVGEDRPVKVDVRLIAATHRDLARLAAEGKFREDLYYRLKVVHLHIPPLRERAADIPVLARHFLSQASRRFGVGPLSVTPQLLAQLSAYSWPGNVRELENAIESLVAMAHDNELDLSLLPHGQDAAAAGATGAETGTVTRSPASAEPGSGNYVGLKERVDGYERGLVVAALEAAKGNTSHAARLLHVNRATLQSKLRKYQVTSDDAE